MNKFIHYTLIFLFISINTLIFAQPGSVPVVEKNGKKYYEHTVEKKQTAYGISRMYNVSLNEMYEANPEAEAGLQIGQKLYIPVPDADTDNTQTTNENNNTNTNEGEQLQEEVTTETKAENNETENTSNEVIHIVQTGETAYSIARKYGVPVSDLLKKNNASENLSPGQKLVIPIDEAAKNDEIQPIEKNPVNPIENPEDSIILHKVKNHETLYSLSQQYGVSIEKIKAANNGLPEGLKKGDKIRIPLPRKVILEEESNEVTDNMIESDTLDVLPINDSIVIKENYNVVILLPFSFEKNRWERSKCPPVGDCPYLPTTLTAMNMYNGMLMAFDSIRKAGANLNIYTFDSANDTSEVNAILKKQELKNADLIIGPLFPVELKPVTVFAKKHKIQHIIPVPVSNKALYKNPYVSKMTASTATQVIEMAKYVAQHHAHQNVILMRNPDDKRDLYYFDLFKKTFNQTIDTMKVKMHDTILESYVNKNGIRLSPVEAKLMADTTNIIIVPSANVGYVSNFFTKLNSTSNQHPYLKYDYEIYGLDEWNDFETLDEKYKNKFKLHYVAPGFINFHDDNVINFIKDYRSEYSIDPDKYGFIGFDAAYSSLKGLILYGKNFPAYYNKLNNQGYFTDMEFEQVEPGSGYENQAVKIIYYDDYLVRPLNR